MSRWLLAISIVYLLSGCGATLVVKDRSKPPQDKTPEQLAGEPTRPSVIEAQTNVVPVKTEPVDLKAFCIKQLQGIPGPSDSKTLQSLCQEVQVKPDCLSEQGAPIFHYDHPGQTPGKGKKILVLSLIHGDEIPSGAVSRAWMQRLTNLETRNSWRVIPLANPDGFIKKSRTNSRGVDLNRNFPTNNWDKEALSRWEIVGKKDPRRYPGPMAASEAETRCYLSHLEDFKPDFIISIHTPLGVLDFDGPRVQNPKFSPLPWVALGHFPGSLGRFMWRDHNIPVLTIELKGSLDAKKLEDFDRLQDISGTIAIQAHKLLEAQEAKN